MFGRGLDQLVGGILALFGVMTLIGAAGFYLDYRGEEAAKRAAREAGPPAAVAIEDFEPRRDVGPWGEVALLARARWSEVQRGPALGTAWLLPLRSDGGEGGDAPPLGFAVHPIETMVAAPLSGGDAEAFPGRDRLEAGAAENGPAESRLLIRGRRVRPAQHGLALDPWVAAQARPLTIEAFAGARAAALAPDAVGFWRSLGFIAFGLLPLLLGLRLLLKREH